MVHYVFGRFPNEYLFSSVIVYITLWIICAYATKKHAVYLFVVLFVYGRFPNGYLFSSLIVIITLLYGLYLHMPPRSIPCVLWYSMCLADSQMDTYFVPRWFKLHYSMGYVCICHQEACRVFYCTLCVRQIPKWILVFFLDGLNYITLWVICRPRIKVQGGHSHFGAHWRGT